MDRARIAIRSSTLRVVALAINTGVAFFLMPFLVHNLGDRLYGYWAIIGAIVGYYGLLDLGIVSAVQFHVAKALGENDTAKSNTAISTACCAFAVLGGIVLLATGVVAVFATHLIGDPRDATLFRMVLLIVGIGVALGFPGRAFVGAISAHLRWDLISIVQMITAALRSVLMVVAIRLHTGLVGVALAAVVCDVASYGSYFFLLRGIQGSLELSLKFATYSRLKEILGYSIFTLVNKIGDQLRYYVDAIVIGAIIGVGAVTHYSVGSRLALSFNDLMIALLGILAPWFSLLLGASDFVGIRKVLLFGTKISAIMSSVLATCVLIYGRAFIKAWMGPAYEDAFWPLVLLLSGILVNTAQLPATSYMYGMSRHRFLACLTLSEGIVNAGLSIWLAPILGIAGVALGTAIPMLVTNTIVIPLYVCKQAKVALKQYFFGVIVRAFATSIGSVLLPWILLFRHIDPSSLPLCVLMMAVQTLLSLTVSIMLTLSRNERRSILRKLAPRKYVKLVPESVV